MKNFRRSLSYLWPYRRRLAVGVLCAVSIAVLWGGGLGMVAPVMKVLISDEGLHGWAWRSMADDRLQCRLFPIKVPPPLRRQFDLPAAVAVITKVSAEGPTGRIGLTDNLWIVGIGAGETDTANFEYDALIHALAHRRADESIRLKVFDPTEQTMKTTDPIALEEGRIGSRILSRAAGLIPDTGNRFSIFLWMLVIALILTLLRDIMRFAQEFLVQSAVYRAMMDLRCENYSVSLHLPVTFYSEKGTTDTMSRFVQDTAELGRGHVTLFGKTMVEPAKAVASVIGALICSWQLTLLAMVAGPPAFFLIYRFGRRMRKASRRALESWSGLLAILEETLVGIRVVKAYTMEAAERKRFFAANRRLVKQQRRIAAVDSATSPSVEALGITAAMAAAGAAGYLVLNNKMDADIFIAWMAFLAAMFDPVRKLAKVATRFQRADAAATRIFELQDRQQEKTLPGAPMLERHARDIEFRNVSYRYPNAAAESLTDIELTVQAGETVAVVGPNGSGKTTLVSLVPRLLDPTDGTVSVDGNDISRVSLRSLRRQIALVTQDTVLFNATIAENIAYGLQRPHREAVLAAAEKAFVHEFVAEMPKGYDTMIGQHGATLSGGQKQRIAIARAILRNPAILIFDEAMSQVDADSEQRIHQAMKEFVRNRTTLLIAHRFVTVLSADRIAVLDAGRLVDVGPHMELLERCELYRHLYRTQFIDAGTES